MQERVEIIEQDDRYRAAYDAGFLEGLKAATQSKSVPTGYAPNAPWSRRMHDDPRVPDALEIAPVKGLHLGSRVSWKSHAGGVLRTHVGYVSEVVAPGGTPSPVQGGASLARRHRLKGRKFVSYVVQCGSRFYWPVPGHLTNLGTYRRNELILLTPENLQVGFQVSFLCHGADGTYRQRGTVCAMIPAGEAEALWHGDDSAEHARLDMPTFLVQTDFGLCRFPASALQHEPRD